MCPIEIYITKVKLPILNTILIFTIIGLINNGYLVLNRVVASASNSFSGIPKLYAN